MQLGGNVRGVSMLYVRGSSDEKFVCLIYFGLLIICCFFCFVDSFGSRSNDDKLLKKTEKTGLN